jgi:hypothetical protein
MSATTATAVALSGAARELLDTIRYHGGIEWQVIHSSKHPALAELTAAGLVSEVGHRVFPA